MGKKSHHKLLLGVMQCQHPNLSLNPGAPPSHPSGFGRMLCSAKDIWDPHHDTSQKMTANFMPGSPLRASPCHGKVRWGMWLQSLCVLGVWLVLNTKNATQVCLQRVWADVPPLPSMGEGVLPSSHFQVTETASTAFWITSGAFAASPGSVKCHEE